MARRVTDSARVLNEEYQALISNDKAGLKAALERIKKAEEDVVSLRRALIRELAHVGTLLVNKEDLLRLAFLIEDIVGHINGTAFKLSHIRRSTARTKKYKDAIIELINLLIEEVSKQNECVRALSINPDQTIETASQIQKLESEIDSKQRALMTEVLKSVNGYRDLIAMKDAIQAIEDSSDAALRAADSTTIVALGV
jgi:predicted phosphate transport protein (TIGR00153 family)